jgi:hypothetical protein
MRRLLSIATFVLLLGSIPVLAQRGGGRASGGHGGFAGHGGMAMHAGGGQSFRGTHSGPGMSGRGFNRGSRGTSFHQPLRSRGFQRFRGPRIRSFGFRNCFGCRSRFAYPWGYAASFDPYWWWDSGSSYDQDREREIAQANEMNAQSLEEQRARQQDQDSYARQDRGPEARLDPPPQESVETTPATVLVYRDQRRQEIHNYAIVGQTLWAFGQRTQKIPLGELDLTATVRANDEQGVDFRLPGTGPGQ